MAVTGMTHGAASGLDFAGAASAQARRRERWRNRLIEAVLLFGIGYNFVLAVVNAKVFAVRPAMTYAAEFAVYAACFLIGLWSLDRRRADLGAKWSRLQTVKDVVRAPAHRIPSPNHYRGAGLAALAAPTSSGIRQPMACMRAIT